MSYSGRLDSKIQIEQIGLSYSREKLWPVMAHGFNLRQQPSSNNYLPYQINREVISQFTPSPHKINLYVQQ